MSTTEVIDDVSAFASMRREWNAVLDESHSNSIFLTWEWLFTRWKHLSEKRSLHILTVREKGQLIGVAPLAIKPWQFRRLLPFRTLAFLGMDTVGSDFQDIFVHRQHESSALRSIAHHFAQHKFVLELSRVIHGSAQAHHLALQLTQHGWGSLSSAADVCPYVALEGLSWETYLATLGAEHRYNLQRRLRNLPKHWRVDFQQVHTEEQRQEAMQWLVTLHQKRWDERGGSAAFATPAMLDFHEEFSRMALQLGWLRLYVLRLNGRPAAVWYGFRYNNVVHFYQSGFDPEFGKFSVGMVMMAMAIQRSIAEQALFFDFLLGNESYKSLWSREHRQLSRLGLCPQSFSGEFYKRLMHFRHRVKRMTPLPASPGVHEV